MDAGLIGEHVRSLPLRSQAAGLTQLPPVGAVLGGP